MLCHHCKNEVKIEGRLFRSDDCPHCGYDLHACLNCSNYEPTAHNQCREPQAEWVTDREKANFCDFFEPEQKRTARAKPPTDLKKSFDDLFKK